jgi:hypothetical protein
MNVEANQIPTSLDKSWIIPMSVNRKKEYSTESMNKSDDVQVVIDGLKYDSQMVKLFIT